MIGYVCVGTSINTFQMYFSMKFNLNLKWIDDRIKYRNLKEPHFKNLVAHEVREVATVGISEIYTPHPIKYFTYHGALGHLKATNDSYLVIL